MERALRLRRVGVDDVLTGTRLDRDHSHRVGDDVMQLAGDAQALLRRRIPRLFLPFALDRCSLDLRAQRCEAGASGSSRRS